MTNASRQKEHAAMMRRIAADAAVGSCAGAAFALIVVLGDIGGFGELAASGGSTLIAACALSIALASSWGAIAAGISIFSIAKEGDSRRSGGKFISQRGGLLQPALIPARRPSARGAARPRR